MGMGQDTLLPLPALPDRAELRLTGSTGEPRHRLLFVGQRRSALGASSCPAPGAFPSPLEPAKAPLLQQQHPWVPLSRPAGERDPLGQGWDAAH